MTGHKGEGERGALSKDEAMQFLLGGQAIFTIENTSRGTQFTFQVRADKGGARHYVSVLTGSDNQRDYTYLGTIFHRRDYHHGRRSTIQPTAKSAQAFAWFWKLMLSSAPVPSTLDVFHEGRCGRCGRPLTRGESLRAGFGPVCADKVAA